MNGLVPWVDEIFHVYVKQVKNNFEISVFLFRGQKFHSQK